MHDNENVKARRQNQEGQGGWPISFLSLFFDAQGERAFVHSHIIAHLVRAAPTRYHLPPTRPRGSTGGPQSYVHILLMDASKPTQLKLRALLMAHRRSTASIFSWIGTCTRSGFSSGSAGVGCNNMICQPMGLSACMAPERGD